MWNEILEAALGNGLWAGLFVILFFVQLKDSKARESKYQEIITGLSSSLNVVNEIKSDVAEIKTSVSVSENTQKK